MNNNTNNTNWFNKYTPEKLDDFLCFKNEIQKIKTWIENYKKNYHTSKKVLLLIGQSGIGKTKIAEVLFKEFGYRKIEFNSSEIRSKKISELFEKSVTYKNVYEMMDEDIKPIGFLIDELDGLFGTGDKGGFSELIDILKSNEKYENYYDLVEKKKKISKTKKTKAQENKYMKLTNPILATCFDSNEKKLNELKKYSEVIYFQKPSIDSIKELIYFLEKNENFKLDNTLYKLIYDNINGDIRKLISLLEQLNIYIKYKNNKSLLEQKKNEQSNINKEILNINLDDWNIFNKFFSQKNNDEPLLYETARILYEKNLNYSECERIFEKDCLLMPLMIYHNSLSTFKNSSQEIKKKIYNYHKSLESLCKHDNIQTSILKYQYWEELVTNAWLYSMLIPNRHLSDMNSSRQKLESTNLLNKISQMLVNKKLVQNTRQSFNKLNLESDEVLYTIHILSHYLGDIKNNINFDNDIDNEDNNIENNDNDNNNNNNDNDNDNFKKYKELNINLNENESLKLTNNLTDFMNQYSIKMEDLENIMKIEKLNTGLNNKKKKFTMKMKKKIENNLN